MPENSIDNQSRTHTESGLPSYAAMPPSASSLNEKREDDYRCQDAKFLQRLLESSQDCVKVLDLHGRLLYMNHEGQRIMEVDNFAQQVRHQRWLSFWCGADKDAAKAAFERACCGETGRFDGYCATAKGNPRWWEVVVTPIFDDDNHIREILSVSRDITKRKKAQIDLEQRNQELDDFASVVSHDLKAPLRGISNLARWIGEDLEDKAPEETKSHLALLQQRVARMHLLVEGLLQVSKVGREDLSAEEVDTAELLSEVIDLISPPAGFTISPSTPLPKLLAKRVLLNQVMSNLISNAIKHHDKARGKIEVTASSCGHQYEFAIIDDGPGIPMSYRHQIFEMFRTIKDSEDGANTGLGLALVKKIVEAEGGKLWLDEKTTAGSKFCFTWPKRSL